MAIKSIFLFASAETTDAETGAASYAIGLAKAHGAQITLFTVALDVTTPGRDTDVPSVAASLVAAAESSGVQSTLVTEHSHALGIHEVIAEHARLHDLSVIGSSSLGLFNERMLAEYLMFESGRPVIVVPDHYSTPYKVGVLGVAWDNTAAAARALGDAIALLAPEQIHFLTISGEKPLPTDMDSEALVNVTNRRGVEANHKTASLSGRSIASALQQEATTAGSNLLVMGAYGHSRLRSFVLGSATADILKSSKMPTLLSH
jgi:nucleotide-binding universal stress UspA family protein